MKYFSHSVEDTYALADKIAKTLVGGEAIILNGQLGAGKTTFTKGLALALGITKTVNSPTFTIIKEYDGGRLFLYHIDMYRIENSGDLEELGIDEAFRSDAVTVIEWNKVTELPKKTITINISTISQNERIYDVEGL